MIYRKQIKVLTYEDALDEIVKLGNTEYLRYISFEYAGTLTAVDGTTDATLIQDGLLKNVLKSLEVTANGSDKFTDSDGVGEYFRRAIMSGSPGVLVSTIPTGEASTAQRVHVIVDFDQIQSAARYAGRIPAARLATVDLRVQGGSVAADMVTGGDRTNTMVGSLEIVALFDSNPRSYRGGARRIGKTRTPISAASNKQQITLPSGQLIADILLVTVDNGVRDNTLCTDIKAKIGERDVRFESTFLDLQSENVEKFGLELASGAPPYTGVALLHFDEDGDMSPSKLLNTVGLRVEGAKLELNIKAPTGTAYVDAYVYGIDPAGVGR